MFKKIISLFFENNFSKILFIFCFSVSFQNCSLPKSKSPNTSPLSGFNKLKLISNVQAMALRVVNGVSVSGFDTGSFFYAYVDDQCVMNRKAQILNSPIYLIDSYLKDHFDFSKPANLMNTSLVETKVTAFISQDDINRAIQLDACIQSLIVTDGPITLNLSSSTNGMGAAPSPAWNDMEFTTAVINQFTKINLDTKVAIGVVVPE
jgi:hypothetical protein